MTTTPKSVILATVILLGLVVLAIVVGEVILVASGDPSLPADVLVLGGTALGGLVGLLAHTGTTPTVPAGSTLTVGQTTLTAPPVGTSSTSSTPYDPMTAVIVAADHGPGATVRSA